MCCVGWVRARSSAAWVSSARRSCACAGSGCGCCRLHTRTVTSNTPWLVRPPQLQTACCCFFPPALIPACQKPQQANNRVAASKPRHSLIACCALSLLVAARKISPGLAAGMLLLRVEVLVLAMLPDASDMASESCDADSLLVAALTQSAALGAVAAAAEEACCCRATAGACGTQQHEQWLPSVWVLGCGLFLQVASFS